jgi:hypothetical protein
MRKLLIVSCLLILVLMIVCIVGFAQTISPSLGVKVGDQFTYNFKFSLAPGVSLSNVSDFDLNAFHLQEDLAYIRVTVTGVHTDLVRYNMTWHYINGTERNLDLSADLRGWSDLGWTPHFFFRADLTAGNLLYNPNGTPLGTFAFSNDFTPNSTISETVDKAYTSGDRLTNHVEDVNTEFHQNEDLYFDKETGVLVQNNCLVGPGGPSSLPFICNTTLIQSNVWSVGSSESA